MAKKEEYAWEDYSCYLGGKRVSMIVGAKYTKNHSKEYIYGEGSNPQAIGRGNISYEASITVKMSALNDMILSAGGDITDIEAFTVVHKYQRKGSNRIVTDIMFECEFTSQSKEILQGNTSAEVELPIMPLRIEYDTIALPNQFIK
jgi:hypothetical protein